MEIAAPWSCRSYWGPSKETNRRKPCFRPIETGSRRVHKKAIVIFGATGDLAQKMLFPSLYFLDQEGHLSDGMAIIGFATSRHSDAEFAGMVRAKVVEEAGKYFTEDAWTRFAGRLRFCAETPAKRKLMAR